MIKLAVSRVIDWLISPFFCVPPFVDVARDFPGQNEATLTVGDLQSHLARLTSVPVEHQDLLHKGGHLQPDTQLAALKVRQNAKMMLLSRIPPDPDEVRFLPLRIVQIARNVPLFVREKSQIKVGRIMRHG